MGQVIRPDGLSVNCHRVTGSVPYEYVVEALGSDLYTPEHRIKCIRVLQDVGVFAASRERVKAALKMLSGDADSVKLRDAAKAALRKNGMPGLSGRKTQVAEQVYAPFG